MTLVTLSDGQPCEVRRLRIFELREVIEPPLYGYFTYEVEIGGRMITAVYEPSDEPPKVTSTDPSIAIWQQHEVDYYRAWQAFEEEKRTAPERYAYDVAAYILVECLEQEDRQRVATVEDYNKVYLAALTPQLTIKELELAAARIFHAKFNNQPIFKALFNKEHGTSDSEQDVIAVWEVETMHSSGLTEQAWSELDIGERARRVVGSKLSEWQSGLQIQKDRERRAKL